MFSVPFLRRFAPPSRIALVTANFGGIDAVRELPTHDGIDAYYFTDDAGAARASPATAASWTEVLVPNYPRSDFNPRLRAKYFKLQIHRLDEVSRHRWLAWADSSIEFHDLAFLRDAATRLERLPPRRRVLLVPHPDRRSVLEEFEYVQREILGGSEYLRVRYQDEKMPEQIDEFRRRGWDVNAKLWCGGLWLIENSGVMQSVWNDWWDQNLRFGIMDQLSLPIVLAKHRITPQALDINLWKNHLFTVSGHEKIA